jgi:hypothetical protein
MTGRQVRCKNKYALALGGSVEMSGLASGKKEQTTACMPHSKLLQHDEEDLVQCQECGKWLKAITYAHLFMHGLSSEEYKEKYGLDHIFSSVTRRNISRSRREREKNPESQKEYIPIGKDEAIALLQKRAQSGKSLSYIFVRREDPYLFFQSRYLFGSWTDAVKEAGLESPRPERWTPEKVLEQIKLRAKKGLSLQLQNTKNENNRLFCAACRYFYSWAKAVTLAGFDYSKIYGGRQKLTRAGIEGRLREWVRENGPLNAKALRTDYPDLHFGLVKYFGGVVKAGESLGLPCFIRRAGGKSVRKIPASK